MKKNERLAVFFAVVATVGVIVGVYGYQGLRMNTSGAVVIETRAPENGNFTPNEVMLVAGETTVLEIRNPETVSHGFVIPALGAGVQEIKPGGVKRITVTPQEPGTYHFYCSTWCTVNHMKMRGKLVVVDNHSSVR